MSQKLYIFCDIFYIVYYRAHNHYKNNVYLFSECLEVSSSSNWRSKSVASCFLCPVRESKEFKPFKFRFAYSEKYSGADPIFAESDVFRITVPLDDNFSWDAQKTSDTVKQTSQVKTKPPK